jgi:uncharacterized protein (DUF2147 family)
MNITKSIKLVKMIALVCSFSMFATYVNANEILGQWKTEDGDLANITQCENSFCIELETGKFSGKMLAKFEANKDAYKGIVYNPAGDNEFASTAFIANDVLEIKACPVAFLCKTQKWQRM